MPKKLEEIKDAILRDPNFKAQAGRTRERAAYAIATSKYQEMNKQMPITKQFKTWMKQHHPDQVAKQTMAGQGIKTPPRPGLVWNPQTHRWIRPKKYSMPNIKGKYMNTLLGSGKIISVKPLTEFFKPGYFEATLANGSKQSGTGAELERMSRT
jgi:hypothetical protein